MIELTEFLLAMFAVDEAVARAATEGPWTVDNERYAEEIYAGDGYTAVVAGGRWGGEASVFKSTEDAIHIARHDPTRVLAECQAKRRIVRNAQSWAASGGEEQAGDTLRLLALTYSGHPDYDERWRP